LAEIRKLHNAELALHWAILQAAAFGLSIFENQADL